MVGGVEKYFQIAKCFRDEDLRADRQPEFTQIDIEASFVEPEDIYALTEGMLAAIFKAARGMEIPTPFPRLTYREAIGRLRQRQAGPPFCACRWSISATIFADSSFKIFRSTLDDGGVVKAINAKGFAGITIGQIDELTAIAKTFGAKGLAFIKVENGEWKSPIVKFFTDAEKDALQRKLKIEEGDLIFFAADKWDIACEVLGRLRLRVAEIQKLTEDSEQLDFLWVTDFPLLQCERRGKQMERGASSVHPSEGRGHPVARRRKFGEVRAEAYDVVLNGVEIGGGSIRIHEPELQAKMFAVLGVSEEDQQRCSGICCGRSDSARRRMAASRWVSIDW